MSGTSLATIFVLALGLQSLPSGDGSATSMQLAQARSCKQVSSCQEAVELWCSGYRRADGDNDGIPCENVCRSKQQVDDIRAQIGC